MSDIAPFCVYLHGCPGFHNVEISTELSYLIRGSKMGKEIDDMGTLLERARPRAHKTRSISFDGVSDLDQAKQHSWVFSDFRRGESRTAVKEYENAADSLGQPFVHVILRCKSERLDSYNRLGTSVPINNTHEFSVFQEKWNAEVISASRKGNELEVDIGDLGAEEAARMIFEGISTILHF
ncbi:hypothetical protein ACHAPE_004052 [Trichoderma viride]